MTDPIAVYGAITGTLGSLGATWGIWHTVVRDRPRLRVKVSTGSTDSYPGIEAGEWLWLVDIMNYGRRPVTISSLPGFEFADGSRFVLSPFPYRNGPETVDEGKKASFWMYQNALIKGLKEQKRYPTNVTVVDDAGNTHRWRMKKESISLMKRLCEN